MSLTNLFHSHLINLLVPLSAPLQLKGYSSLYHYSVHRCSNLWHILNQTMLTCFRNLFVPLWAGWGNGWWWELGLWRPTGWEDGERRRRMKWGWEEMQRRRGLVGEGRRLRAQEEKRRRRKRRGQAGEGKSGEVSHPALDERPRSATLRAGLVCPLCFLRPWWVESSPCCPSVLCALKTSSPPLSWTAWSPGPAGLQQKRVQWIGWAVLPPSRRLFGNLGIQSL